MMSNLNQRKGGIKMIESFGGRKSYYEDSELFEDQEKDPFSEEPVNIIVKKNEKIKDKSKKSKKNEDKLKNQDIPNSTSTF